MLGVSTLVNDVGFLVGAAAATAVATPFARRHIQLWVQYVLELAPSLMAQSNLLFDLHYSSIDRTEDSTCES